LAASELLLASAFVLAVILVLLARMTWQG